MVISDEHIFGLQFLFFHLSRIIEIYHRVSFSFIGSIMKFLSTYHNRKKILYKYLCKNSRGHKKLPMHNHIPTTARLINPAAIW